MLLKKGSYAHQGCIYSMKNKQNCMHFREEHRFGCALALLDCVDEYVYHIAHKTFIARLKRYR